MTIIKRLVTCLTQTLVLPMRQSERQRIEILMMLGYGDRIRTQQKVCNRFNQKYPKRPPIIRSTVSRIETKFRETGTKVMNEETSLQVLLEVEENPNTSSQQLSGNYDISK
jgi:hypothetical protein